MLKGSALEFYHEACSGLSTAAAATAIKTRFETKDKMRKMVSQFLE